MQELLTSKLPELAQAIPAFAPEELQVMRRELLEMDCYCRQYRDHVRAGSKPTFMDDVKFMAFQKVCYAQGVANE